jgi:hypothetical protein
MVMVAVEWPVARALAPLSVRRDQSGISLTSIIPLGSSVLK